MSEIGEDFALVLRDLTVNNKQYINMLTILADDNLDDAPIVTRTILSHLQKVKPEIKLPVLYLIDSILKNVGKAYIDLFTQHIVEAFTSTFETVDKETQEQMLEVRKTWDKLFPAMTMYALDNRVKQIDPGWPCTVLPPSTTVQINYSPKYHIPKLYNPDKQTSSMSSVSSPNYKLLPVCNQQQKKLIPKQKMLLELEHQKLKLELLQTQAQIEETQCQFERQSGNGNLAASALRTSELMKLQQRVSQEEAKLKKMSKNFKKVLQDSASSTTPKKAKSRVIQPQQALMKTSARTPKSRAQRVTASKIRGIVVSTSGTWHITPSKWGEDATANSGANWR